MKKDHTLKTNQLDFLRPFTLAYQLPTGEWHTHFQQDQSDISMALELVLSLRRAIRIRHEATGEVVSLDGSETSEIALKRLNLFYNRINDRSSVSGPHSAN